MIKSPTDEELTSAKETVDHMAQIDMQAMEQLFNGSDSTVHEPFNGSNEQFDDAVDNELSTPDEFFEHLWQPCFNGLTAVSGYNTFSEQSNNRIVANIIYRKIANNPYLRPILDTRNAGYADLLHIGLFLVGLIGGVVMEFKQKKLDKALEAQKLRDNALKGTTEATQQGVQDEEENGFADIA